jgi:hypothetical protein
LSRISQDFDERRFGASERRDLVSRLSGRGWVDGPAGGRRDPGSGAAFAEFILAESKTGGWPLRYEAVLAGDPLLELSSVAATRRADRERPIPPKDNPLQPRPDNFFPTRRIRLILFLRRSRRRACEARGSGGARRSRRRRVNSFGRKSLMLL